MPIAVKRYYSGMNAGAPALSGTAGTLVSLLDACLIDGFQTKTVSSATQTGGTATVETSTAHGYGVNDVIVISGANESAWNDEFRILTVTSTTFTFAIGSGTASPATGSLSCKIAPLGWTKPFSGTNKAAYLPKAQYVQCYLRVQDDSSTPYSANGRWAKVRGYETMSNVDTGSGLFPTVAQATNGLSFFKSDASSAATRGWWLVGDGGIFYMGTFWHNSYLSSAGGYAFGDPNSLRSGDAYSAFLAAEPAGNDGESYYPGLYNVFATLGAFNTTQAGKYLARSYNQLGGSLLAGMVGDNGISINMGCSGLAYPHPVDNGLLFSPVGVVENNCVRSRALPGLYYPLHVTPLAYLDVIEPQDFPGRKFQAFDLAVGSSRAQCLIDITGPWR